MPIEVQPTPGSGPGAVVTNLTAERLADATVRDELRALWIEHGLLVLRGLGGGGAAQVELSRCFGELIPHPIREAWVDGHPELIDIRYDPAKGPLFEVGGRPVGAWLPWHSDLKYMDKINHGGVLRALEISPEGGRTGFIDQIAAYDRLPAALQARIEGLDIVYRLNFDVGANKFLRRYRARILQDSPGRIATMARIADYPAVLHPIVYVQADTGRKVLSVCPYHALGVHGLAPEVGDVLLEEVFDHCLDERFAYLHAWRPDDVVVWDNWRMLHCVEGIPPDASRWMQRTTIAGDYALGRHAADAPAEPL